MGRTVVLHGLLLWQKHRNSIGHSCGIAAASCNVTPGAGGACLQFDC